MKKTKNVIAILLANLVLLSGSIFASFPVKTAITEQHSLTQISAEKATKANAVKMATSLKKNIKSDVTTSPVLDEELLITLLLWFFLGFLAAHRWYRKKPTGWNILFILTVGGCGIWALIDLINILTGKF
jgi:hypothetical protein